jgi:hypothetical protein
MKPAAYVTKYKLSETDHFSHDEFVADMKADFTVMVASAGSLNFTKWNNILDDFRIKWDKVFIGSKVSKEKADKLWGFFWATIIIPTRDDKFKDYTKQRHDWRLKNDMEYREEQMRKKYRRMDRDNGFDRFGFGGFGFGGFSFDDFLKRALNNLGQDKVSQAMEALGMTPEYPIPEDKVKAAFRAKAKTCHPDMVGAGKEEEFHKIQEAYDFLMEMA